MRTHHLVNQENRMARQTTHGHTHRYKTAIDIVRYAICAAPHPPPRAPCGRLPSPHPSEERRRHVGALMDVPTHMCTSESLAAGMAARVSHRFGGNMAVQATKVDSSIQLQARYRLGTLNPAMSAWCSSTFQRKLTHTLEKQTQNRLCRCFPFPARLYFKFENCIQNSKTNSRERVKNWRAPFVSKIRLAVGKRNKPLVAEMRRRLGLWLPSRPFACASCQPRRQPIRFFAPGRDSRATERR